MKVTVFTGSIMKVTVIKPSLKKKAATAAFPIPIITPS